MVREIDEYDFFYPYTSDPHITIFRSLLQNVATENLSQLLMEDVQYTNHIGVRQNVHMRSSVKVQHCMSSPTAKQTEYPPPPSQPPSPLTNSSIDSYFLVTSLITAKSLVEILARETLPLLLCDSAVIARGINCL